MSAEVESMMYVGQVPWHGDGVYVGDEGVKSDKAMPAAGLDWLANPTAICTADGTPITSHRAIVRDTDEKVLGVVGNRYTPFQNHQLFEFGDALVNEGQMSWHTAGSLRGGKRVWAMGKIGSYDVLPGDKVDKYMFFWNTHDGSGSVRALFTNVRVVCANTARAALIQGKGEGVSLRHTSNIMARLDEARNILGLAKYKHEEFEDFSKALTRVQIGTAGWEAFTLALVPDNEEAKFNTRSENTRKKLTELFELGRGTEISGVRGTGWGAYNAVTEFCNYHKSTRGDQRFESTLFGSGASFINKATNLLVDLSKAA